MEEDVYYYKTVPFRFGRKELQFRTSRQLFSSHDIDTGTRFLLRTIVEADYPPFQRILDVGCGYGPLGLSLKSLYPANEVHLFDRDALAVEYSKQNAALNGLDGVEIYGSLGYDDVKQNDFDLIASNIPDHAPERVITYLLREAQYHLSPSGIAAVVVVSPLEDKVVKILSETPGAEIILKLDRPGHTVFHYRFSDEETPPRPPENSLERGIYSRQNITMKLDKFDYTMQTADGLPEFDSLSYGSELLVKALENMRGVEIKNSVVFNPGQGHLPIILWKLFKTESITLVDRDLLALRYSLLNLTLNDCSLERITVLHQAGLSFKPKEKPDLIIAPLREDESKKSAFLFMDNASALLNDKGTIIVSADSTTITRLVAHVKSQKLLRIKTRERHRGYSLLLLQMPGK